MTPRRLSWLQRVALAAALVFTVFPIYWLLATSVKPWEEFVMVSDGIGTWVPSRLSLQNYRDVFHTYMNLMGWEQTSSWRGLVSSTAISAIATALSVGIGLLAALAFARYRVGGNALPLYVLSFRMVPPMAVAIPIAILLSPFDVKNTPMLLPPIYAAVTVPLATWMLKSFIDQVPQAYEDAAMLDGMSRWQAHFRVTVPMIKGGLMATILFVFILNWTETPIALALSQGAYSPVTVHLVNKLFSPHVQVSLAVLAMVPPLIIGIVIQRHLGRAFTFGAVRS